MLCFLTELKNAPSANKIALKNSIAEVVHTNVRLLDDKWAKAFVAEAIRLGAKVIGYQRFPMQGPLTRQTSIKRESE